MHVLLRIWRDHEQTGIDWW